VTYNYGYTTEKTQGRQTVRSITTYGCLLWSVSSRVSRRVSDCPCRKKVVLRERPLKKQKGTPQYAYHHPPVLISLCTFRSGVKDIRSRANTSITLLSNLIIAEIVWATTAKPHMRGITKPNKAGPAFVTTSDVPLTECYSTDPCDSIKTLSSYCRTPLSLVKQLHRNLPTLAASV
jgi:hypothetical protein